MCIFYVQMKPFLSAPLCSRQQKAKNKRNFLKEIKRKLN